MEVGGGPGRCYGLCFRGPRPMPTITRRRLSAQIFLDTIGVAVQAGFVTERTEAPRSHVCHSLDGTY